MASIKKTFKILILLTLACISALHAERIGFDNFNFLSIDFPQGFQLSECNSEGTSFLLENTIFPVTSLVRIYTDGRYKDCHSALTSTFTRLNASNADVDSVKWRNQNCAIAGFDIELSSLQYSGYACAVPLSESKDILVCLVYTLSKDAASYNSFMVSLIDSICIDRGSYTENGIMTEYLYPKSKNIVKTVLTINGQQIETFIKDNDEEAADYVVDREYDVLKLYAASSQWKEAWIRYYRMIYRDSYGRLSRVSFDIYNALSSSCNDETDLAQKILTWTQDFPYERNKNKADFTNIPSVIMGHGSDCDSRSMLVAILLNSWNQDAIMMISRVYSHALCGMTSTHKGHSFRYNNKDYLMGETTQKGLTWGKIAQNQDKTENWIFIDF